MNLSKTPVQITRAWAMPSHKTFSIKPIAALLDRHLAGAARVIDPFSRGSERATHTNDLDPTTSANLHMDARDFCRLISAIDRQPFDAVLFDPPYSPRQIVEVYKRVGLPVGMKDTQNARLYAETRNLLAPLLKPGGLALSFGWNSGGFGESRGFKLIEILLVCHGAAHNDTICTVEVKS